MEFNQDGSVRVIPIDIDSKMMRVLGSNLMLFYTDITRKSGTILKKQKSITEKKIDVLRKMRDQVIPLKEAIEKGEFYKVGEMLHEGWLLKKSIVEGITNSKIDRMYDLALSGGASGGKVSGAGGGGFLLLYCERELQNRVREKMSEYRELPFFLERGGSRVIFNVKRYEWK